MSVMSAALPANQGEIGWTMGTTVFLCGAVIVLLLCCMVIVRLVVNIKIIRDLERKEMALYLQLEEQRRELEDRNARAMVSQIRPHFIYNVLSSIRYLVKKRPEEAYDLIYDFSKYLRSNMANLTDNVSVSWREELEHIKAYINIEKMRFGERLQVHYEIEEEGWDTLKMPPLLVELLVENAVKHGIEPKPGGGNVWVRGLSWEGGYEIMVEDDGVGFDVEELDNERSLGFSYIRSQLRAMDGAGMRLESIPNQGTKVWIYFTYK